MKTIRTIFVLCWGLLIFSCDTEDTVEPNYEDYFVKYYGEEGNQQGVDIEMLPDGYLLIGNSRTTGGSKGIFVVHTDLQGNRISYGTLNSASSELNAVDAVSDDAGNLFIVAESLPTEENVDIYIAKISIGSISGEITPQNEITFSMGDLEEDVPQSITHLSNGDIIVTGYTTAVDVDKPEGTSSQDETDILAIRLDAGLNLYPENQWRRIYGQDQPDYGHGMIEKDGEYLFFASSNYASDPATQAGLHLMVFPVNEIGIVNGGYKTFGSDLNEYGRAIIGTSEGGSLLIGDSNSRILLTRLNAHNEAVGFPTTVGKVDVKARAVFAAVNGGYLVAGNWSDINNQDFYLAKIGINYELEWERTFGGLDQDNVSRVCQSEDGSVMLVGTILLESQEKMCMIKLNPDGDLQPVSN
ncbi:MAG: hypothetical protein P8X57_10565 [Cyclobacteriaceae bacterium]